MYSRTEREKRYVSTETRFDFNIEYCIERIGNNVSYTKINLSKVKLLVFYICNIICYIGYITRLNCLFNSLYNFEILKSDHAFFIRKTHDQVCIENITNFISSILFKMVQFERFWNHSRSMIRNLMNMIFRISFTFSYPHVMY